MTKTSCIGFRLLLLTSGPDTGPKGLVSGCGQMTLLKISFIFRHFP